MSEIRLTQFSSAAGCGCKIDSEKLKGMLQGSRDQAEDENLYIGNQNNEDAAAYFIDDETLLLSTLDFFTPVVDDPYEYGYIAAANAISDIFAMGGRPIFALSILGWPMKDIPESAAMEVLRGSRDACANVRIPIAGGHSIENKEPIFGLSVNGLTKKENIKLNRGAKPGDLIMVTKPLGTGILTTAIKKNLIRPEDYKTLLASLRKINLVGYDFGKIKGVHAMTDITGFGFAGHLSEVCNASNVSAKIEAGRLPLLCDLSSYINSGSIPGGLNKNWKNYSAQIDERLWSYREALADPQTNGPLLICVDPDAVKDVRAALEKHGEPVFEPVGEIIERQDLVIV